MFDIGRVPGSYRISEGSKIQKYENVFKIKEH